MWWWTTTPTANQHALQEQVYRGPYIWCMVMRFAQLDGSFGPNSCWGWNGMVLYATSKINLGMACPERELILIAKNTRFCTYKIALFCHHSTGISKDSFGKWFYVGIACSTILTHFLSWAIRQRAGFVRCGVWYVLTTVMWLNSTIDLNPYYLTRHISTCDFSVQTNAPTSLQRSMSQSLLYTVQ